MSYAKYACLALAVALGARGAASGQQPGCASCGTGHANCAGKCGHGHPCPPHFKWYAEGPPAICIKCACPRPVCDPCELKHFGYYQTCWAPWPYPPDWSHCPTPPPGEVLPPPAYPPYTPRTPREPRYQDPRGGREADLPAPNPANNTPNPEPTSPLPAPVPKRIDNTPTARLTNVANFEEAPQPQRQPEPPKIRLIAPGG